MQETIQLEQMQKQLDWFREEEKKPPLKENGEVDWDAFGARLQARFALEKKYYALEKKLKEQEAEKRRLDEIILSDAEKAECTRIKQQYELPADADDRKIKMNFWTIRQFETECAQCSDCAGLPCKKKFNQGTRPVIEKFSSDFVPYIKYCRCTFDTERRLQAKVQKMQGLSKIPPEYANCTFADYQVDDNNSYAVKVAKALVEHPEKGAFFFGNVGTGKTFLAAITAQEMIKRGRQVIFATVPAISKQLRSTFNSNSKTTESEILEQLETAPTLILDDVGLEKPTRFVCSTICNLFNERYNARLQTIMTSNYTLKQLENIFNNPTDGDTTLDGTRIYDRCKQMCVPIELKGKSRRD